MMNSGGIDALSRELLGLVCDYLDHDSLRAFGQTSKQNGYVANSRLFRYIAVHFSNCDGLVKTSKSLMRTLTVRSGFQHVRKLLLEGVRHYPDDRDWDDWDEDDDLVKPNTFSFASDFTVMDDLTEWDQYSASLEQVVLDKNQLENAWKEVATVVRSLPGLTDFVYHCRVQLPPCIFEALQEVPSPCRLHIKRFAFHSLDQEVIDAHELAIVTSPLLYNITVSLSRFRPQLDEASRRYTFHEDYQEEAIIYTIRNLSPNLNEVLFNHTIMKQYPGELRAFQRSRAPWRGFGLEIGEAISQQERKSLSKFSWNMFDYITVGEVLKWCSFTDLSRLRAIKLKGILQIPAMNYILSNKVFQHLKTLDLNTEIDRNPHGAADDYQSSLDLFITGLPCLENLRIHGVMFKSTYDRLLERHGSTLRRLLLDIQYQDIDYLNSEWSHVDAQFSCTGSQLCVDLNAVQKLQGACALLEELQINILRSKGNSTEMAIYKTLGMIPRLQTLSLTLEGVDRDLWTTSQALPIELDFDERDQMPLPEPYDDRPKPRVGHVKSALINVATDKALALAIYRFISQNKSPGSTKLRSLTIQAAPFGKLDEFGNLAWWKDPPSTGIRHYGGPVSSLRELVNGILRQAWRIERCLLNGVESFNTQRLERTYSERRFDKLDKSYDFPRETPDALLNVIKRTPFNSICAEIWPNEVDADGNWNGRWASLPLSA